MKTITEITQQKRNTKRCNLFLDGEFFCGIQLITVMQYRLKKGTQIDENKLRQIVFDSDLETANQLALGYVAKSMHTKMQIIKYLKGKNFDGIIIAKVIDKLSEYGYVNDEAYSKAFCEQRKNVKGKRMIAYELKFKGVDEKTVEKVLAKAPSEENGAFLVATKFFKNKEINYDNISKCYRRLISKGFDYDIAKNAIDRIKRQNENFED